MRSLLLLGLLAACSTNGHTPAAHVQGTAPDETPSSGDATDAPKLSPEMVAPYFADGALAAAAARFALEDWQGARDRFAAALAEDDLTPELAARARLLVAVSDARLADWTRAATGFERAIEELPQLADWLRYEAARARFFLGDREAARAHAAEVAADSVAGDDARLLVGDVLRGLGDPAAVEEHYATYLGERDRGIRRAEARYRLGEAVEAQGRAEEAAGHYRLLVVHAPLTAWAARAQQRLDAIVPGLPAEARARLTTFTADDYLARGMEYYDAMRNEESEADFTAALAAPGLTSESRCVAAYHRANSVFKQRNRTRAAPLFDAAIEACAGTENADLQVKSAYQAGRSYANIGERETALARYALVESQHPEHSYADDARLRQAEEHEDLGNDDQVTELLSTTPKKYPDGDMRARAMWRLAWRAYKKKDYRQAIRWLDEQIRVMPIDDHWSHAGQAQYWKGRSHARLGDDAKAIEAYREAVFLYPLSYYALLSLNRLRERHPDELAKVVAEMKQPPADPSAGAFDFRPRELYGSERFARAMELLRLGLAAPAQAELDRLGFRTPPGKQRLTDDDEIDKVWAMAFLNHAAGRYTTSHWVTRWHVLDYQRHWPEGAWRAKWEIAYPRGWWDLLHRHASEHGYPTELLIAFVREESAFNPLQESFANAIGLTQMIFPTARRFAKGTGIVVSREALRDPEKNVTIGSRFLAFLMNKWKDRVGLVVPSYNAGEGATARWLRERGDWPQDEWAEEIPYDETRGYNKRVTATYFVYSYLNDGTIPVMPNDPL